MKALKIILTLLVLGGGIALLLRSTMDSAFEYYKHVDEVADALGSWQGKPLQLHGFVEPGSMARRLDRDNQRVEYRFRATNCARAVDVIHAGSVPDTFKDGSEVVVKGRFEGDLFRSSEVMAKCPSKYEATSGARALCAKGKAN